MQHQTLDSPVIYGNRVETSNPYYLTYIDKILAYISKETSRLQAFFTLFLVSPNSTDPLEMMSKDYSEVLKDLVLSAFPWQLQPQWILQ